MLDLDRIHEQPIAVRAAILQMLAEQQHAAAEAAKRRRERRADAERRRYAERRQTEARTRPERGQNERNTAFQAAANEARKRPDQGQTQARPHQAPQATPARPLAPAHISDRAHPAASAGGNKSLRLPPAPSVPRSPVPLAAPIPSPENLSARAAATGARALAYAHERDQIQDSAPQTAPTPPPPQPLDPITATAITAWQSELAERVPSVTVSQAALVRLAADFTPAIFAAAVRRHTDESDPTVWARNPLTYLRIRCEWERARPPKTATTAPSYQRTPKPQTGRTVAQWIADKKAAALAAAGGAKSGAPGGAP